MPARVYFVDVNILGELFKYYPQRLFPDLYAHIDGLIDNGCFRVPDETYREVMADAVREWLDERKSSVVWETEEPQLDCLRILVAQLPAFVDHSKPSGRDADHPFVAHAMACNFDAAGGYASGPATVLTNERLRRGRETRLRIPDACDYFDIRCGHFLDLIEDLGLEFGLRSRGDQSRHNGVVGDAP